MVPFHFIFRDRESLTLSFDLFRDKESLTVSSHLVRDRESLTVSFHLFRDRESFTLFFHLIRDRELRVKKKGRTPNVFSLAMAFTYRVFTVQYCVFFP